MPLRPSRSAPDGTAETLYLHTSPEFAAKKLLAAGETRIFEFARVFRNRERTRLHAPEFTMLEWYRAGEDYRAVIADSLALLRLAADIAGAKSLRYRDRDLRSLRRSRAADGGRGLSHSCRDRSSGHAVDEKGDGRSRPACHPRPARRHFRVTDDDDWSDIFTKVLAAADRAAAGTASGPRVLYEYPRCEAALARPKPADPRLSERFELYACGVELANGFGELTDPMEQRAPLRRRDGRESNASMASAIRWTRISWPPWRSMPPASGVALGFDRLVMLATGAPGIDEVLWTPLTARSLIFRPVPLSPGSRFAL